MKRNVKILTVVLSLLMLLSTGAIVMMNASAVTKTNDYLVISGTDLASAGEIYGITTTSTANGVWSFTTTNNDPYVNTAAIANVGDTVLRTYPYVVVRYKTNQFTSMEIFSGHPGTAHRRVSMPAPATNGQWGCLFYDFSQFPDNYKSWFRLEPATASGINMEIAEVVLFKNNADVTNYHNVYVKAGSSTAPTVLTFNDFGYHGATNTGRNGASGDTHGITEVRPDNNEAMFNEGGYFTRLTSGGGGDGWIAYTKANTAISAGISTFAKVAVRYRAASDYNGRTMQIFFGYDNGNWSEGNSVKATIKGDASWQWAFFTKPTNRAYDSIRFDYMDGTGYIDIAEIYFYNDEADIYNAQVGINTYRNNPGNTWFNGGMYMLHKSNDTYFQSVGTISGGTLNGYQRSATGANFQYGNSAVSTVGRTFYKVAGTHSAHNSATTVSSTTADCITGGSTTTACSLCGGNQKTTTTAALGHDMQSLAAVEATYSTTGLTAGTKCSRCSEGTAQTVIPKLNPLTLSYNVTLGEKFALNVKYVGFDGSDITVTDAAGNTYACTTEATGATHTDGNPIYAVKIAGISARDIASSFTVTENTSGYNTVVSVDGYCAQMDSYYAGKSAEDLAADFVAAGYDADTAAAMAEKQLLAYATTQAIDLYGQAAGNYFNQDSADHATLAGKLDAYTPTNTDRAVSNTGDVQFKGASLVFGDEVELLFRMENYNREQIFVNDQLIPEDEINSHLSTDGTYVYFSWTVKPSEFATVYTIRAGSLKAGDLIPEGSPDDNGFEGDYYTGASTITYSVDAYIAAMQAKYATDTSAKGLATMNLVNALGNYGVAATAYAEN